MAAIGCQHRPVPMKNPLLRRTKISIAFLRFALVVLSAAYDGVSHAAVIGHLHVNAYFYSTQKFCKRAMFFNFSNFLLSTLQVRT